MCKDNKFFRKALRPLRFCIRASRSGKFIIFANKTYRTNDHDTDVLYRYHHDYHRLSAGLDSERRVDRQEYYGIDIREYGSKNAGTTNMLRVLGRRAALPVFALDFLKGFVAVTLIEMLKYDENVSDMWLINLKIIAVFAAVLGHIFPIFAGFRGGKGVATLVGAVTGIYPRWHCSASACGSSCS